MTSLITWRLEKTPTEYNQAVPGLKERGLILTSQGIQPNFVTNLLGNGGRNEVVGPGLVNFDFSLFKENKIKENLKMQFRAEFFNVFNHSNFESPIDNSTLFNQDGSPVGGAGLIDATSTANREIQFALKLIF